MCGSCYCCSQSLQVDFEVYGKEKRTNIREGKEKDKGKDESGKETGEGEEEVEGKTDREREGIREEEKGEGRQARVTEKEGKQVERRKGKKEAEKSQGSGREGGRDFSSSSAFSFGLLSGPYLTRLNDEFVSHRLSPPSNLLLHIDLPV